MTDSQGHRVTEAARIPSRRRSGALLGVVLALAVAAGCSGSSHNSSGSSDKAANKLAPSAAAAARGPAQQGAAAGRTATPSTPLQQRDIVRTATVELHTRDVNHAADTIVALADPAGGRVDGDDRAHAGRTRTATLVLRVPPDTLSPIITKVDALGTETSRSVHGEDVTASKADITARTIALQTSVSRLRSFLSHSGSIGSLVSLESQLTQRESELESIQGQQRALSDKIALATLTVRLSTTPKPAAKPRPKAAGLGAAFVSGWHALIAAVRWVVRLIGYSLPITAVVVLVGGTFVVFWRRRQRVGEAEPTPESSS